MKLDWWTLRLIIRQSISNKSSCMSFRFTDMANEELMCVSSNLYAFMNAKTIGCEVRINIRRTTTNLRDDILRKWSEIGDEEFELCFSGSKAEGFRFRSSDDDWMLIMRHIRVIPSESYTAIYDSNTTLLLMENEITKPGFTLLRLIGGPTNHKVSNSSECVLNGRYLSCKRWRELHTREFLFSDKQFTHGPCVSAELGGYECDFAFCLRCDYWPTNASDFIRRLNESDWPSHDTILSIVGDGVLFVPIGAKQSIFENTEWRMSFSLAEKKLIHAMNHTQFLCYGLLKIFLKQAIDINLEVKGLLCSYFVKTALLWEITATSNQWNPSTLLSCFWKCFQRLLCWISCSYCPNFFVPHNNMFEGKIKGTNRYKLLEYLRTLYCEGYICLLRCESLSLQMSFIAHRHDIELEPVETNNIVLAGNIIRECLINYSQIDYSTTPINLIVHQLSSTTDSHKRFLLKIWLNRSLRQICMTESDHRSAGGGFNRSNYQALTVRMNILAKYRTDSVSHFLYQALLCYRHGRYNYDLRLVQQSKEKVCDPRYKCVCNMSKEWFIQAGGENLTIEEMLKRNFIDKLWITIDQYLPELYFIESRVHVKGYAIHPLALTFFLQFLCKRKLGSLREANEASYDLSLLLTHTEQNGCTCNRGTSWHILGICQQMSANDEAACHSCLTSLQQSDNWCTDTTCIRLGTILAKYLWHSGKFYCQWNTKNMTITLCLLKNVLS